MKLTTQLYIFLITVLAVIVYIQYESRDEKPTETLECETTADTVFLVKTDTVKEYVFKVVKEKVIDTIYVETENKPFLALPVVSKHFAKENLYDLWITGVEPLKMDSISVYPKTIYKELTKTNNIVTNSRDLFVNVGVFSFNGILAPKVGVSLKTKKEWLYGAEIGSYNGKVFYGVNVGIKINK